jgi:hypothetical protein
MKARELHHRRGAPAESGAAAVRADSADTQGDEARTSQIAKATPARPSESQHNRGNYMKLKLLLAALLGLALFSGALAQGQQDNGGIKQDTKDAAHSTGQAAKKSGRKIKHGTKKAVHKGAHATSKGADKVEDKTAPKPSPTPQN